MQRYCYFVKFLVMNNFIKKEVKFKNFIRFYKKNIFINIPLSLLKWYENE